MEVSPRSKSTGTWRRIPPGIWALGFVSLLADIASEMVHSLRPVSLVSVIGTNVWVVGLIDGVAEATAVIVKVFSGALSDYVGKRKPLAVLGYRLGAASKPLFALATTSRAWLDGAREVVHLDLDRARQLGGGVSLHERIPEIGMTILPKLGQRRRLGQTSPSNGTAGLVQSMSDFGSGAGASFSGSMPPVAGR